MCMQNRWKKLMNNYFCLDAHKHTHTHGLALLFLVAWLLCEAQHLQLRLFFYYFAVVAFFIYLFSFCLQTLHFNYSKSYAIQPFFAIRILNSRCRRRRHRCRRRHHLSCSVTREYVILLVFFKPLRKKKTIHLQTQTQIIRNT